MDVVRLPTLPALTDLETAWRVMEESRRSAVVIERRGRSILVHARAILMGIEAGKERLDQLRGVPVRAFGYDVERPALERRSSELVESVLPRLKYLGHSHQPIAVNPERTRAADALLASVAGAMALLAVRPGQAYLLTLHELIAEGVSDAPRRCYCRNSSYGNGSGHLVDRGKSGQPCPSGDGYTLICRR